MKAQSILFLVACSAFGCSSAQSSPSLPPLIDYNSPEETAIQTTWTNYTLVISPAFSTQEITQIQYAANMWSENVPVKFAVIIAAHIGTCLNQPGMICIFPITTAEYFNSNSDGGESLSSSSGQTLAWGWTNENAPQGNADIQLYATIESVGESDFTFTVAHELGHAQGLVHHPGCFLMNPAMENCISQITVDDVDQWWSLRTNLGNKNSNQ